MSLDVRGSTGTSTTGIEILEKVSDQVKKIENMNNKSISVLEGSILPLLLDKNH